MRKTLLASAAAFGVALAAPAVAHATTADDYLRMALDAVRSHHPSTALISLNNAENEMLASSAVEEAHGTRDTGVADPPVVRQTARAREAIEERHWQQAESYIKDALSNPGAAQAQ